MLRFDPDFDDARWTLDWLDVPIKPVPLGWHTGGYQVIERWMQRAQIFDRMYEADEPFLVRALLDSSGMLWMSDTPQERMMMHHNAMQSHGHVLIGGLGLGLYPQYAAAHAERFTIVEHSTAVIDIVGPMLRRALSIPFEIVHAEIEEFLSAQPSTRYDTIFLDTWDTLDAKHLPQINGLRDLALRHLAPQGRVLLWGYRWMLRLFEDACRQLLNVSPDKREMWLSQFNQSEVAALLQPVVAKFVGEKIDDMDTALTWCRTHIIARLP